jgi:hypothetical protein
MSTDGGFSGGVTGLNPGSYSNAAPTHDALGSTWDNLFYPAGSPPTCTDATGSANLLDVCGVDFLVAGGDEVNIFGSIGTNGYDVFDGTQSGSVIYDNNAPLTSFTVSAGLSPEPSASLLLGTGLPGLAVIRLRKARRSGHFGNGNV